MIPLNLNDYETVDFSYHTGTRYVLLTRYEYGHIWHLKVTGLRTMADAFTVPDEDFIHSQILAITHRDLLSGDLADFVNDEVNNKFKPELELVPF